MILHITNDYSGSTVYMNLVKELDNLNVEQIVYNPIRDPSRIGVNNIPLKCGSSQIIYSNILTKYSDRIFYRKKIKKIVKDIESKVDIRKIKFIHAHTWYSDGGVAYLLSKKYNIPYLVAIRNTDVNLFYKYFIHERLFAKKILQRAQNIITISEVYKNRILNFSSLSSIKDQLISKINVLPNGVDEFWIRNKNSNDKIKKIKTVANLLYIGKFDSGKNVLNLVKAVKEVSKDYPVNLTLVGGGGKQEKIILEIIKLENNINFKGKIFDKDQLLEVYKNHDLFLMPSKGETFGLVYVEAMLQGLPILYTVNEGIDGFYDNNIGEKVTSFDVEEIRKKVILLIQNYDTYSIPIEQLAKNHDWKLIANKYKELYRY